MNLRVCILCFLCIPCSSVLANLDLICERQEGVTLPTGVDIDGGDLASCFDSAGCELLQGTQGTTVAERRFGFQEGCDPALVRDCCESAYGNPTNPGPESPTTPSVACDSLPPQVTPFGSCEGALGDWDPITHTRQYIGAECRMVTSSNGCEPDIQEEECQPCGYEEEDLESPTCESVVDWSARPVESIVLSCEDDLSGCDENSYENGTSLSGGGVAPARACDNAGNCVECSLSGVDTTPPTCRATFFQPGRWHRDDKFEINGGPVRCWLESCEDHDPDGDGPLVASGCLEIPMGPDTPKEFTIPGTDEVIIVEQDPLIQQHRDFCVIQVCDNAGNCNTCQSPEIAYDGTDVCRSAIGFCGACDEDDYDCRCISGERDMCTNTGSINCYADPFHERCPGFDNPACLANAFIPGCPVFNPCYPETNRDHPKSNAPNCPADAIRFCTRNPYHYGCNEACKFGLIRCVPDVPDGGR